MTETAGIEDKTPTPLSSSGGDAYLVSALVEKPGHTGHRSQVGVFASKEDAIGSSLALWQTDGWSVSSYDCKLCNTVVPKGSLSSSPRLTEDELAAAFQDGFTNGNAAWEETPDYHKDMFREGVRCLLASLAPTPQTRKKPDWRDPFCKRRDENVLSNIRDAYFYGFEDALEIVSEIPTPAPRAGS